MERIVFYKILFIVSILYTSSFVFTQVEIREGEQVYKCGSDTLVLHAKYTGADYSNIRWYVPLVPFPQYVDTFVLKGTPTIPQQTRQYILAQDYLGTTYYDTILVTFWRDKPTIALDGDYFSTCSVGTSVTVTDTSTGVLGYEYEWSNGVMNTNTLTIDQSGTYILKKTTFPTDCFRTDTFVYALNDVPTIDLPEFELTCGPMTFNLDPTITNGSTSQKITWSPTTGISNLNDENPFVDYDGSSNFVQKYYAQIEDTLSGCVGNTDSVEIEAYPIPKLELNVSQESMAYCDLDSVEYREENFNPVINSYIWRDMSDSIVATGENYFVKETGAFYLTVFGLNSSCINRDTFSVEINNSPSALSIDAPDSVRNDELLELVLSGTSTTDDLEWSTTGTQVLDLSDPLTPIYSSLQNDEGALVFSVTKENNCGKAEASKSVFFIQTLVPPTYDVWVPNSLQPNNSNPEVSVLKVYGENIEEDSFSFAVYNKWGQVIFESNSFDQMTSIGWSGDNLPADAYTYTLSASFSNGDPIEQTGSIVLVR